MTNALAYFGGASITQHKSFLTLTAVYFLQGEKETGWDSQIF
jgi:hypothetical protein